jgi:hypothetical protein
MPNPDLKRELKRIRLGALVLGLVFGVVMGMSTWYSYKSSDEMGRLISSAEDGFIWFLGVLIGIRVVGGWIVVFLSRLR